MAVKAVNVTETYSILCPNFICFTDCLQNVLNKKFHSIEIHVLFNHFSPVHQCEHITKSTQFRNSMQYGIGTQLQRGAIAVVQAHNAV